MLTALEGQVKHPAQPGQRAGARSGHHGDGQLLGPRVHHPAMNQAERAAAAVQHPLDPFQRHIGAGCAVAHRQHLTGACALDPAMEGLGQKHPPRGPGRRIGLGRDGGDRDLEGSAGVVHGRFLGMKGGGDRQHGGGDQGGTDHASSSISTPGADLSAPRRAPSSR